MGNQNSLEEHHEFKNITTNYNYERKYNDARFGEVKLLKEKNTGVKVFQKDLTSNTKKEYDDYVKEIKKRSTFQHPNLLKVLGFSSKREDMFCADFFKVSLYLESFEQDLEQEIFDRAEKKDYFQEVELWYIFDSLVSVLAFFQEHKIYHGDIRPFNIFVTASKDYKVCDTGVFRSVGPSWFLDSLEAKSHYPSPQYFKVLSGDPKNTEYDRAKNDVFSLGMTMLEVSHLDKCNQIYEWDDYSVNSAAVEDLLAKLKDKGYSETWIQTLRFTLNFSDAERPDFITLDRELAPYRADIRARISTTNQSVIGQNAEPSIEDELDKRVRAALRKSEETISRSSPSKYHNKYLDPYIHSYLSNEPLAGDKPLLQSISPHLSVENKYTMTLTQYPGDDVSVTEGLAKSQFTEEKKQESQYTSNFNFPSNNFATSNTTENVGTTNYGFAGTGNFGTSSNTNFDAFSYKPADSTTQANATTSNFNLGTFSFSNPQTNTNPTTNIGNIGGTTDFSNIGTTNYGTTNTNFGGMNFGTSGNTNSTTNTTSTLGGIGGFGGFDLASLGINLGLPTNTTTNTGNIGGTDFTNFGTTNGTNNVNNTASSYANFNINNLGTTNYGGNSTTTYTANYETVTTKTTTTTIDTNDILKQLQETLAKSQVNAQQ